MAARAGRSQTLNLSSRLGKSEYVLLVKFSVTLRYLIMLSMLSVLQSATPIKLIL